jgi:signal peptidase I
MSVQPESQRERRPGVRQWFEFEVSGWLRPLIGRRPMVTSMRVALIALICFGLMQVMVPVRVSGASMEPTYRDGKIEILYRRAYVTRKPQRGDVVGLRKEGTRLLLLKRVLGLPGERIAVRRGRVYVNGAKQYEPYAQGEGITGTRGEIELGPDEYFAIGDNRSVTIYGVVHLREIVGRAP